MSVYLDASVVVSLFIEDVHTPAAERWENQRTEPPLVSPLCVLEFSATVSRSFRMGRRTARQASDALADFDEWRLASTVDHGLEMDDFRLADAFLRDFATRLAAADALHLATAMSAGATLVTFDERLAEAAHIVGAEALVPA